MPLYKILHFRSLTSTQDKAKALSKKGFHDIVIIADIQTKGRGRFKRKWHSTKGGLWMSILLKPKNIGSPQYLTFIAAISVVQAIKKICNLNTKIKWPNDVHYKDKKLCGILTECVFGKDNYVIVGIGLNVNQSKFANEIRQIATSLRMVKHRFFNVKKIMNNISNEFFSLCNNYYNKNRYEEILKIWEKYCDTINKNVVVITKTRKLSGKAIGVDKDCSLLLKLKNNKTTRIVEGDITVRY